MIYRQLYNQSPAIMIVLHAETGKIINVNQAALAFYGYSLEHFLKLTIYDLMIGDFSLWNQLKQESEKTRGQSFICQHRLSNLEVRNVEVFASTFQISDEKFINTLIMDVTDKIQKDKELMESHERMSLILDGANVGTWEIDLVHNYGFADNRVRAILGYTEEEYKGTYEEWAKLCHPDDIEKINQARQNYMDGKTDKYEIEYRIRHKEGSYRWVYTTMKLLYDEEKRPLHLFGILTDITKRKELEELELESEKRLKEFAQALPNFSAIMDEDGRYIEVFGQSFHSIPHNDLKGRTFHDFFPSEIADKMLNDIRQCIGSGAPFQNVREFYFRSKKRFLEARIAPMSYTVDGKKTVVLVISDITERLKTEGMLHFTYQLKRRSDFLNDLVHSKQTDGKGISATAQEWGINLRSPLYCCLIQLEEAGIENRPLHLENPKNELIYEISELQDLTVWENHDTIGILFQSPEPVCQWKAAHDLALELEALIKRTAPHFKTTIALSDRHSGLESVRQCYQEALNTLNTVHCHTHPEGIYHFKDIGLFQLLTTISGEESANDFVQRNLGPLIAYDSEKGSNLLQTLEEILRGLNIKTIAQKLFIHPKTLTFRKQRIEKLLAISLDDFETRLSLAAALKLYKLIPNQ